MQAHQNCLPEVTPNILGETNVLELHKYFPNLTNKLL